MAHFLIEPAPLVLDTSPVLKLTHCDGHRSHAHGLSLLRAEVLAVPLDDEAVRPALFARGHQKSSQ